MLKNFKTNPYLTTAVYYAAFIGLGMTTASLGPTLQGLANNTNSSLAQISSLFLILSLGYLLGSLGGGRVYDRVKGHPVMAASLAIMAAMMALAPLVSSLWVLAILLMILGFAEGMLDVGSNTLIVWLHRSKVPPFMNGLHAFFGIGTTIAPLIVAWVLSQYANTINLAYWILAALVLPPALIILLFPSPVAEKHTEETTTRKTIPLLIILAALIFFLYVGAEVGFAGWIYTYTTSQGLADPAVAASINAAFWAAFTFGRLASIPLAIRFKPNIILWIDLIGCMLSLLAIIAFPKSEWALWAGTIGTGLFMASIFPTILNDTQGRMQISSQTTSWFFVGASLGGMLLPWLMGQLIGPFGPISAMIAVFIAIAASTLVFGLLNIYQRTLLPHPTDDQTNGTN
jgi:FHS family Na+ dependent glucose MFS transporter 1